MRNHLIIMFFLATIAACAHSPSMVGVSGGKGANLNITGPSTDQLFDLSKMVLEENGCTVIEEIRDEEPNIIKCSGTENGNSKITITKLSPTSHRLQMWNSKSGMLKGREEKIYVNNTLAEINRRALTP